MVNVYNEQKFYLQNTIEHTTTKLTREMAFNEMFQAHIMPPILTKMSNTTRRMISAATKSKPIKMNDTTKMIANEMLNENTVSFQMVKYCS